MDGEWFDICNTDWLEEGFVGKELKLQGGRLLAREATKRGANKPLGTTRSRAAH